MQKLPELSIFFPFWNEEDNVRTVVKNAIPVAKKVADKWEIILVDDGSTDDTLTIAKELAKQNEHIRVISHKPNRGYGAALKAGLTNARYKYIVFTDGDAAICISCKKKVRETNAIIECSEDFPSCNKLRSSIFDVPP